MSITYTVLAAVYSLMLVLSGIGKLRRDPYQVKVVHELVGVPMAYFPLLGALEFAGAAGLIAGHLWPWLGVAAAVGVVLYFVGAAIGHLRVGDRAGTRSPAIMLAIAIALLVLAVRGAVS
jgi:uncharacterized membrane protein YphA (DoxX/SURF4 family)